MAEKRKVVVIGQRVYEVLFNKDEDPINQYIEVQGVYFQVIGLFKSKRSGEGANEDNQ